MIPSSIPKIPSSAPLSDAVVIAKGAGVNLLGTLAKAVKSVSFVILTRLFGAEIFGLYVLAWSVIDLTAKLGNFGLDKGVLRFLPRYRQDRDTDAIYRTLGHAFSVGLLLSVLTGVGVYAGASLIADRIFAKPDMAAMLRVLALTIPGLTLTWIVLGVTRAHKIMKYDAYIKSIAEPLILFGVACTLFFVGWRTLGIAVAHTAAVLGGVLCAAYVFGRFYSWRRCLASLRSLTLWSELTRFSLPVMGYDFLYILMVRLDTLMVGYFLPALQVGIYAIAIEIALTTKRVRQWFDPIFAPIISELHHLRDMKRLEYNFVLVTRWVLTINMAFLGVVMLIGKDLLGFFGPAFGIGFMAMVLLALSQVVYASIGSGDTMLIMAGHPYTNLINTGIVVVFNIILNLLLIPRFEMAGAALGTLISFGLLTLIRVIEVYRLYRIHPFRRVLWKPCFAWLGAFAVSGLAGLYLPDSMLWRVPALPALFLVSYGVLLWRSGLEEEDRTVLRRFHARIRRKRDAMAERWRAA